MGPDGLADLKAVQLDLTAGAVLAEPFGYEELLANVGGWDVVLRVVGPLPHVQGSDRVENDLTGQHGADPAGDGLDVVDQGDHGRVVDHGAHLLTGLVTGSRVVTGPELASGPELIRGAAQTQS